MLKTLMLGVVFGACVGATACDPEAVDAVQKSVVEASDNVNEATKAAEKDLVEATDEANEAAEAVQKDAVNAADAVEQAAKRDLAE